MKPAAVWTLAALAAAVAAASAWWLGMNQGMAMMATPVAVAAAPADPSQWTIPQGEAATRRHIQDGIKAGDVDPVTGLRILNYHDPMVPGRNFDAPAKSPFMDMMLVPRYAGGGSAAGADDSGIAVNPRIQQNLGLRTAPVVQGVLAASVQAVGTVVWNERSQVLLQARATGFVEKLHVRAPFDRVAAHAPIAEIYVPAWVAAQEEFLALQRMRGPDLVPLREAARQRMRLAGMDEALIAQVAERAVLQPRQVLTAPISGVVTELMLREGATVMPGATLLRIQGTATVWAEGEVPESQASRLRPGDAVAATSPALPGARLLGRVQTLLPAVDPATRTRTARLELANPGNRLVPGMTLQMRFPASATAPVLMVPSDAVIHTGRRSVVMLAEAEGRFRPLEVTPGQEANGQTEIVAGLQLGQRVVLSGQFLIDSEASLRGLDARLNAQDAPGRSRPDAADPAAVVHSTPASVLALNGDTVTLEHPAIPTLKWPPMKMDFRLPPRARQPRDLAAGDSVQIEFRMSDGDVPQITAIQRTVPPARAASGAGQ